jgi:hypothetical protein
MGRESSKHGPQLDEEMAHETEDIVRSGHAAHTEEWRQPEPVDEGHPFRPVTGGPPGGPGIDDIETRSLLARELTPGIFPADGRTLRRRAEDVGLPPALTESIASLPAGQRYANVGDLARALGLATEPDR